ncbi:MAG: DNA-processing protein DprA [Gammaproteobacteria bacterium]|nr:DNA-processing protein DprA [Gammaproteobacteria bacterium]MBU1644893.1 DNA-processing protein DprA [Gammaproteobacteria bacterium]MBU1971352.1 DNA-processing protein DprA [Gammaproteobacteria bacterium]
MPETHALGEIAGWIRLTSIPGVGGETQRNLLKAFGPPEAIFAASGSALRGVIGAAQAERLSGHDAADDIEAALNWAAEPGNRIITLADADYPQALLTAADPPVLLYVKGRAELLNRPAIAIVGSRSATKQGEANAEAFAAALSAAGLTVVSGLALGIDAAAHRGALKGPGSTVAFIGTGADRIYPAKNAALTREIAAKACVVSEFPLGMVALQGNFPRRNRLIAGISLGCLVVEAAERSGSLITARLAGDAGREVFAIPGSIHSPLAKGCHKLIRQGAKLVETAADILEELRWENVGSSGTVAHAEPAAAPDASSDALLSAMDDTPTSLDTLAQRSGLTPGDLLAILLPLELEGRVAQLPGGLYQRVSRGQGSN